MGRSCHINGSMLLSSNWSDEFLIPIRLEVAPVSVADRAVVERATQKIQTLPTVTDVQLSAQHYFERAVARVTEDYTGKIADYTEAIRLNPTSAPAYRNRGVTRWVGGDISGAIADQTEAIRLAPGDDSAYFYRGVSRYGLGDFDGAIADYSEAIRLAPDEGSAYQQRGFSRREQGDLEGAEADFRQAKRLKANNPAP